MGLLTDVCSCCSVGHAVKQPDQTTGIPDCLLVPDYLFSGAVAVVLGLVCVLVATELLVCVAHREDQKEGMGGARHKGEQLGLVNAEDVMEGELLGEAKLVDKRGHDLGVVLCKTCEWRCFRVQGRVLPRGMNLFLPAGTSGLSSAMVVGSVVRLRVGWCCGELEVYAWGTRRQQTALPCVIHGPFRLN